MLKTARINHLEQRNHRPLFLGIHSNCCSYKGTLSTIADNSPIISPIVYTPFSVSVPISLSRNVAICPNCPAACKLPTASRIPRKIVVLAHPSFQEHDTLRNISYLLYYLFCVTNQLKAKGNQDLTSFP